MNHMKQVAQMLGVELYEVFKLDQFDDLWRITEDGVEYYLEPLWNKDFDNTLEEMLLGVYEIIKISKPILDSKEKEYLSHIIKPFKEKIKFIRKSTYGEHKEYISIRYCEGGDRIYNIEFPEFKKGTMYRGMELYKHYTLEELGL